MPADHSSLEPVARALIGPDDDLTHLGTGGFASTFKVAKPDGSAVALKVVDPDMSEADRVNRELAALQRVNHPNVVAYRRWGETEHDGVTFRWIEMDYVEGQPLGSLLRAGKQYTAAEAAHLLHEIVAGAEAIWAQDTAHRDLSPNNILVTNDGVPVIVDLGMARHLDDETITALPTPGTPGWMSPEQVGSSPTHGDWRSDQFVLGLVGYTLLTGTEPFVARNAAEAWFAPAHQTPRSVRAVAPSVPAVIADVVEKMIARQPHRRYLRSKALLDDLSRAVAALAAETATPVAAVRFYLEISQAKTFAEDGFIERLSPAGVIIDARARARVNEFCVAARDAKAEAIVDPSTIFARSPLDARPAQYLELPHGSDDRLTGFSDDAARRAWIDPILELHTANEPSVLIAPYFFAGEGELNWIRESLSMARVTTEMADAREAEVQVWTGMSLSASWLTSQDERDRMLAAVTAQGHAALYLLVHTNQQPFAPIGDVEVLRGFRDVIEVMTEAQVPVIAGRRSSSGLLLLSLGAFGWSTGVAGNLKNATPHPEEASQRGGPGLDRIYVPELLNHINLTSYVQMLNTPIGEENLRPTTTFGEALLEANPTLDTLTAAQRVQLLRHNLMAMKKQVSRLDETSAHSRLTSMRELVLSARDLYRQLPQARPGEEGTFLEAWLQVL